MWKCLNDWLSYCASEPDFVQEPCNTIYPISWDGVVGNKCKLDPKTCGRHQTLTESIAAMTAVKPKGAGK